MHKARCKEKAKTWINIVMQGYLNKNARLYYCMLFIYFIDMKSMDASHLDMMKLILYILIFKSLSSFGIEGTPLECKEISFVISYSYEWNMNNHQCSFISVVTEWENV